MSRLIIGRGTIGIAHHRYVTSLLKLGTVTKRRLHTYNVSWRPDLVTLQGFSILPTDSDTS